MSRINIKEIKKVKAENLAKIEKHPKVEIKKWQILILCI